MLCAVVGFDECGEWYAVCGFWGAGDGCRGCRGCGDRSGWRGWRRRSGGKWWAGTRTERDVGVWVRGQ